MMSFFLILSSLNKIWANFDIFCSCSVVIRDMVGNLGQVDDKTLFGDETISYFRYKLLCFNDRICTKSYITLGWPADRIDVYFSNRFRLKRGYSWK